MIKGRIKCFQVSVYQIIILLWLPTPSQRTPRIRIPLLGWVPNPQKVTKSKRSPNFPFSKCSVETMVIVQTNRHKVSRRWMLHRWDFPLQFLIGQLLFPKFHQQFCKTINQILFGKIFTYFVNNLNWTDSKNTATAALIEQTPWISQLFLFFYLRGLSLYNIYIVYIHHKMGPSSHRDFCDVQQRSIF